jgi:hypothetical protein
MNIGAETVSRPAKRGPEKPLSYQQKVEMAEKALKEQQMRDEALREQMLKDKTPIPEDRRPLVRKHSESYQYSGFVVGDQRDATQIFQDRKALQLSYKEQLERDLQFKAKKERDEENGLMPSKDFLLKKRMEQLQEEAAFKGLVIGKDPDEVDKEKKLNAMKLRELSLADQGGRVEFKTLREQHEERTKGDADAQGYYIGADESLQRSMKKERAKEYYEKLSSDIAVSPSKGSVTGGRSRLGTDSFTAEGEYIERTGQTGFVIGGLSSDGTKSQKAIQYTQKLEKQAAYRQELLHQQKLAENLLRAREAKDREQQVRVLPPLLPLKT